MPQVPEEKQVARFRLLAGAHIGPDLSAALPPKRPDGTQPNRPSRSWTKGQVVEAETDLVAKFGPQKFELLEGSPRYASRPTGPVNATYGDPTPENLAANPATAPHGQVSSGHPYATRPGGGDLEIKTGEELSAGYAPNEGEEGANAPKSSTPPRPGQQQAGAPKAASVQPPAATDLKQYGDLSKKSAAELRDIAEAEEIDLGSAKSKDEILKKLQGK